MHSGSPCQIQGSDLGSMLGSVVVAFLMHSVDVTGQRESRLNTLIYGEPSCIYFS